jgi:hypothetical protein
MKARWLFGGLAAVLLSYFGWMELSSQAQLPAQLTPSRHPAHEHFSPPLGPGPLDGVPVVPPTFPYRRAEFAGRLKALKTTSDPKEVLAIYKRGLPPGAAWEDKYLAAFVGRACAGYANPTSIRGGGAADGDAKRAIMTSRIGLMTERCSLLSEIGAEQWHIQNLRLARELNGADSPFSIQRLISTEETPLDGERLASAKRGVVQALDGYGTVALDWESNSVIAAMATLHRANASESKTRPDDFPSNPDVQTIAAQIAPCFDSQPCGNDSLYTLGICVGTGGRDCENDLVTSALDELERPEDKEQALRLAKAIALAVQTRNWQQLGLDE